MALPVSLPIPRASRRDTAVVSTGLPTEINPTAPGRLTSTRRAVRSHSFSSSLVTAIKVSATALLWLLSAAPAHAQLMVRTITSVGAGGSDNAKGLAEPNQKHSTSVVGRASLDVDIGY